MVNYFTKWVEEEALAKINIANILKVFKRNLFVWYGISRSIMTKNGTQFKDKNLKKLLENQKVKQHFMMVEYLKSNGQAEAKSQVLLRGLKIRPEATKGNWENELPHVLCAYSTTPH